MLATLLAATLLISGCSKKSSEPLPDAAGLLTQSIASTKKLQSAHLEIVVNGKIDGLMVKSLSGDLTNVPAVAVKGNSTISMGGSAVDIELVVLDGTLYAAWRHVFTGNFRDMGFTSSRDGGKTFSPMVRVNQDGWSINGCPDDGPAMAVDAKGVVHLVWPTVQGGTEGALLYAVSKDGRTFSAPVRVPTLGSPKPSHPQVAIDGGGRVVIAWDEVRSGVRGAAYSRMTSAAGAPPAFGPIQQLGAGGPSAYPVFAAGAKGLVAVWTAGPPDKATIAVKVID